MLLGEVVAVEMVKMEFALSNITSGLLSKVMNIKPI